MRSPVARKGGEGAGVLSPSRGLVNGNIMSRPRGRVNGTSGDSRRGFVNGTPSDARQGLVNGMGRVNGLQSPGGLTNGLPRQPLPRNIFGVVAQKDLRIGISLLLLSLLLLAPAYYYLSSLEAVTPSIVIDGDFEDWASVPRYGEASATSNPHINLREYGVLLEGNLLFLYARVDGIMLGDFNGYDSLYAFIDQDGDSATGYAAMGLGADYLVEVTGGNGSVAAASLMEFLGPDPLNWSGWTRISGVSAIASGASVEVQVPVGGIEITPASGIRFRLHDNEGLASVSSVAVGPEYGALTVEREAVRQVVGGGASIPLLRLTLKAVGTDVTIQGFTFSVSSNLPPPTGPQTPLLLEAGVSEVVDVPVDTSSVPSGALVSADVSSVIADRPATFAGEPARAYVDSFPAGKTVDGVFLDWVSGFAPDPPGDVGRGGLDLVETGADADSESAFFYARTAGSIMTGDPVPTARLPPGPSVAGQPSPPPVTMIETRTGEDVLRVYVDTNASDQVGLPVGPIWADRLLSIRGYDGQILSRDLFEWQAGWVLTQAVVAAEKDADQIEMSVPLDGLGTLDQAEVIIEMTDWAGTSDKAESVPGLRSYREGTKSGISYDPLFSGDGDNLFVVTGTQDFDLNSSSDRISMRFTAKNDLTTTEVRVYFGVVNSPPTYTVGLQGDSSGSPDGSYVCSGTTTPASVGWETVSCSGSTTAGTIYHLVVEYSSGTIGPSNYASARYTTPNNNIYPNDGSSDTATDVVIDTGGGWTSQNAQPVYVVDDGSVYEGNPYHDFSVKDIFGTTGWGDKFSITSDRSFNQAKFYVNKTGSPPDLVMKLREITPTAQELRSVTVSAASVGSTFSWVTFSFTTVTLSSSATYAIYLEASGGGGDSANKYSTPASVTVGGSPYEALTYDGTTTNQTEVDTSGPTFTDTTANDIPFQLIPEFGSLIPPAAIVALIPLALWRRRRPKTR